MDLQASIQCDVLVVGSGLAGIRSAISAAETGRSVLLCSGGKLFSGSSFYPGTWGLGLIGPDGEADEGDLADAICTLGRGMADPELVRSFVSGIHPAIEEIRAMGIRLKEAQNKDQKDFIPCFDRKHRSWNGILFDSAREVFSRRIDQLGIRVWEKCELLRLTKAEGRVDGAVVALEGRLRWIHAGAVVLCTGGLGGLYQYRLTTDDVISTGQTAALEAGVELVNLEFMQIMPGFTTPCPKTIYNEKTFRWLRMYDDSGAPIVLPEAVMELRSTHGPFTSRLVDREVDFAILRHQGDRGVLCGYDPALTRNTPEFVKTYFDWLYETHGLTMEDPFRMALYAHAANGGIRIDSRGYTGVPGLYAAGECTGGMHGADRIGGLSTANGLVFGARAGRAAAEAACHSRRGSVRVALMELPEAKAAQQEMRSIMTRWGLVERSEAGLKQGLQRLEDLTDRALESKLVNGQTIAGHRVYQQLLLARCVLTAQEARRESRGSHFRRDHPVEDPSRNRPIRIRLEQGRICTDQ